MGEPGPEPVLPLEMTVSDLCKYSSRLSPKPDAGFLTPGSVPRGRLADHIATFAGRQLRPSLLQTLEHAISSVGVSVVVLDALLPGRPITMVNAAFERMSGFTADEAIGSSLSMLLSDSAGPDADALQAAVADGQSTSLSVLFSRRDGRPAWTRVQVFPVRESGLLTSVLCILQDVDELIRSEREARLSKEHLSAVVQRVSELVIIVDPSLDISYANPAVQVMLGYEPGDLVGRPWLSLVHEHDQTRASEWIHKGGAGVDASPLEFQALHHDGSWRYLEASISVLPDAECATGTLISAKDITDLVALRERQTRLLLEATINGQEEERERICLDIHDGICQTLATAFHYLDMVDLGDAASAEQLERMRRGRELVRQGIRQAREIVASLRPARLDALGLVAALRYDVHDLGEREGMRTEFEADVAHLNGTVETALYRIIHEALSNVGKHAQATKVRVTLRRELEWLVVTVEDNGVGLPHSPAGTNPLQGGVGMISMRRRTELLQGRFDVRGAPGEGTTVRISFALFLVTNER
jgi:PAS domain S-box-containing protein